MSESVYNFEVVYDLSDDEIADFCEANIWPAAEHFWGDDFGDPDLIDTRGDVEVRLESAEGLQTVMIGADMDAIFEKDDDGDPIMGTGKDTSFYMWFEAYRDDVTEMYQKARETNLSVWEQIFYDFPLDGIPKVSRNYVFKDEDGEDVDIITKSQKEFIRRISRRPNLDLDRSSMLNSQDCVDIHNILLALEVPETAISLTT